MSQASGGFPEYAFGLIRKASNSRKTAYGLAALAVLFGVATVATTTGVSGRVYDLNVVLGLLYADGILMLLLGVVVGKRLLEVWIERRRGMAGAGLHVRLMALFSVVAVTPAILVTVFSALFLNFGMESWFSERVRTALNQSRVVAKAYLSEHNNAIKTDVLAIANNLNDISSALMRDRRYFADVLSAQASLRSLSEAVVFDGAGRIVARGRFSLMVDLGDLPINALEVANRGKIAVLNAENDDRLKAMIKLNRFVDLYLLVERFVDTRVIDHIEGIERAVSEYRKMEKERGGIQISFIIIFVMVSLLLLLAAAWIGLTVSTQLAVPISRLIGAAEDVTEGNLDARVDASDDDDEISLLGRAFNNMTGQLQSQQTGLIEANRELDERRRFTETVLEGVSAGVVGLDSAGVIHLHNRSASELLGMDLDGFVGAPLSQTLSEMSLLMKNAGAQPTRTHQAEIRILRKGEHRTMLARIVAERRDAEVIGYVLTFDDVTELLSAQRKAAWADVARRIAHEIKNPLTPIQLSAERLRRRYLSEITSDPETFTACTETIVRQVEDIGRMVDEFSAFARMPEPKLNPENLTEICRNAVFLERNRDATIEFVLDLTDMDIDLVCDRRQLSRALSNVIKNAVESINARLAGADDDTDDNAEVGRIRLSIEVSAKESGRGGKGEIRVVIEDNGRGLPTEARDRLTEPYVTTREKGTGLGLAIVKKIMEDHGGALILEDRDGPGARAILVFRANLQATEGNAVDNGTEKTDTDPTQTANNLSTNPDLGG